MIDIQSISVIKYINHFSLRRCQYNFVLITHNYVSKLVINKLSLQSSYVHSSIGKPYFIGLLLQHIRCYISCDTHKQLQFAI